MKHFIACIVLLTFLVWGCKGESADSKKNVADNIEIPKQVAESIYQFEVNDLYGENFDFSSLKGKKLGKLYFDRNPKKEVILSYAENVARLTSKEVVLVET